MLSDLDHGEFDEVADVHWAGLGRVLHQADEVVDEVVIRLRDVVVDEPK